MEWQEAERADAATLMTVERPWELYRRLLISPTCRKGERIECSASHRYLKLKERTVYQQQYQLGSQPALPDAGAVGCADASFCKF